MLAVFRALLLEGCSLALMRCCWLEYHIKETIWNIRIPTSFAMEEANLISVSIKVTALLRILHADFYRKKLKLCLKKYTSSFHLPSGNFHCKEELNSSLLNHDTQEETESICSWQQPSIFFFPQAKMKHIKLKGKLYRLCDFTKRKW